MIELIDIEKEYVTKKKRVKVLNKTSYKFKKKMFYVIKGKSGAGKTTLVKILGLLLKPSNGILKINNKDVSNLSEKERDFLRAMDIGFVFQSYYLNPLMNAMENVELALYLDKSLPKQERKVKAKELLESVGLESRIKHFPKELSGGEQQRVAIARSLANNPSIILADEPTGALDEENEDNILAILKQLAKDGKCVIVVSHSDRVKEYADVVLELKNKELKEVVK